MPGQDPEKILELEEEQKFDELEKIVNKQLEETSLPEDESYHISYVKDQEKTGRKQGTFYKPDIVAPRYQGPETELELPIETSVDEFYVNVDTGDFKLKTEKGSRNYQLILSCDQTILLKGELGFGNHEETSYRYTKGDTNELNVFMGDNGWCKYGDAEEVGEGNRTMREIELIEISSHHLCRSAETETGSSDRITPRDYTESEARRDIYILENAFGRLETDTVNSLPEFEREGEAFIGEKEHPFTDPRTSSTEGARGGDAARRVSHKATRLYQANIIDYSVEVGGKPPSAVLRVREDLERPEVRSINDFLESGEPLNNDRIYEIVERRFEG